MRQDKYFGLSVLLISIGVSMPLFLLAAELPVDLFEPDLIETASSTSSASPNESGLDLLFRVSSGLPTDLFEPDPIEPIGAEFSGGQEPLSELKSSSSVISRAIQASLVPDNLLSSPSSGASSTPDPDPSPVSDAHRRKLGVEARKNLKKCSECKKLFLNKLELNWHLEAIHAHTIDSEHTCHLCGCKFFKQGSRLKRHLERTHQIAMDPSAVNKYYCVECQKYFSEERNLKNHNQSLHSNAALKCNKCGRIFNRKDNLKRHRRRSSRCKKPNRTKEPN